VGRTCIFCHVIVLVAVLALVMVIITVEPSAATVAPKVPLRAVWLILLEAVPLPAVTFTVTAAFFAGSGRGDLVRNFSVGALPTPASPGKSTSLTCFLGPSC